MWKGFEEVTKIGLCKQVGGWYIWGSLCINNWEYFDIINWCSPITKKRVFPAEEAKREWYSTLFL